MSGSQNGTRVPFDNVFEAGVTTISGLLTADTSLFQSPTQTNPADYEHDANTADNYRCPWEQRAFHSEDAAQSKPRQPGQNQDPDAVCKAPHKLAIRHRMQNTAKVYL